MPFGFLALLAAFGTLANSLRSNNASVLIRTLLRCSARPNGGGIPHGSSASRTSPEWLVRCAHIAECWSFLISHASLLSRARHAVPLHQTPSLLTPHSSLLRPHSSLLTPHSSPLTPHPSLLTPHSSFLTPHPSLLTPHSSPLTPHSSLLTPHPSLLTPHSSLLTPHSSPLTPHPSLLTPHSYGLTPHPSLHTGSAATFAVSATGSEGGGALVYQWKKNGTDIPGATSSTYTTPATSNADIAAELVFSVAVSNSAGTTVRGSPIPRSMVLNTGPRRRIQRMPTLCMASISTLAISSSAASVATKNISVWCGNSETAYPSVLSSVLLVPLTPLTPAWLEAQPSRKRVIHWLILLA